MKTILCFTVMIVTLSAAVFCQNYKTYSDFLSASSGAQKFGVYGFDNPAVLTYLHQPDVMIAFSDAATDRGLTNRFGFFAAAPNIGFGVIRSKTSAITVNDYRVALSFGDHAVMGGLGYGWSTGDVQMLDRKSIVTVGTLVRPMKYVSTGLVGVVQTSGGLREAVLDVAGRPFGNELLMLFADYAYQGTNTKLKDGLWSVGAAAEPLAGIRVALRYQDTKALTLGFELSFGNAGISSQSHFDSKQKYSYNTYAIRAGAYDRSVIYSTLNAKKNYVEFNLLGPINYQRFLLFDNSKTLQGLIAAIDAAKSDPSVSGIAINTSGMMADREKLWEVREKLKDFKSSGKKVVMFIDRGGIDLYHFASVSDKIVMDPIGVISFEGFLMGRTFMKGTLEKLGIGFDEWRFFKYKSAVEILSREKMSDADREQRQKLIDDYYKLAKQDIIEGRNISPEKFDQFVNDSVIFMSTEAIENRLVDTLGRWETVKEVIKKLEGEEKKLVSAGTLAKFQLPHDNYWGDKPRIAIIYALGACAMDEGITARKLVKDVEAVTNDSKVKAVVLRVDSPGGDAMASDIIAEALKKCKEKKPVIISQGYVAASGGYWLSMYGDTIVAAPNTITGSIGVIGGWMYNKGLKESLGMTTDFVKAGAHADIGFGFTLPLISMGIPDRNFTPEEHAKMENMMKTFYKEFVKMVASGRKKKFDDIEPIAQGRVWSGFDGKQNGLVDVLGGLETAVNIAKEKAGFAKDQEVAVVEYPKKGLFDISVLIPKLIGIEIQPQKNELIDFVKFRLKHNGEIMPILPLDMIESYRVE